MNKIFKNKIFLLLMFSVLFVLAFNCNSFADSSKTFTLNSGDDVKISIPDEFNLPDFSVFRTTFKGDYGYLVFNYDHNKNTLYYDLTYTDTSSGRLPSINFYLYQYGSETTDCINYIFINYQGSVSSSASFKSSSFWGSIEDKDYYSTSLVYDYHDSSKVVFQGAPQAQVEPLMEITQVEEIQPAVAKIVDLVLPACLIIFGTLLVLYLIKSKNLLQV